MTAIGEACVASPFGKRARAGRLWLVGETSDAIDMALEAPRQRTESAGALMSMVADEQSRTSGIHLDFMPKTSTLRPARLPEYRPFQSPQVLRPRKRERGESKFS